MESVEIQAILASLPKDVRGLYEKLGGKAKEDFLRQLRPKTKVPDFGPPRAAPPPVRPPVPFSSVGQGGMNWGTFGLGALAAPFSPWIGARFMAQAAGGGGGKGGGGITGALFGGSPMMFGEFYLGIQLAIHGLRAFAAMVKEAADNGARLFQRAARTGMGLQATSQLGFAFQAIGLSPDVLDRMMTQPRLGGRGLRMGIAGQVIGASGGAMGVEQMQQVINMAQQLDWAMQKGKAATELLAETAPSLNALHMQMMVTSQGFSALKSAIVDGMAPAIQLVTDLLGQMATGLASVVHRAGESPRFAASIMTGTMPQLGPMAIPMMLAQWGLKKLTAATGAPQTQGDLKLAQGGNAFKATSGWERMGLIVHGGLGGTDYAKQTAQNTKLIADRIQQFIKNNMPVRQNGNWTRPMVDDTSFGIPDPITSIP